MEAEEAILYPLSQRRHSGFYHAYGRRPPQDFLQTCLDSTNPQILVMGCGDIQSCLYTLWKNFDASGTANFDGVHFVLNDISAAVLARDILLLYLCISMPQEINDFKKWLSSIWAIWYCHELLPEHQDLLNNTLSSLCQVCHEWANSSNPLYPFVKFSSPATLDKIREVWNVWLQQKVKTSATKMHSSRKTNFKKFDSLLQLEASAFAFVKENTELSFENYPFSKKSEAQKSEVLNYMKNGSVYAESALGVVPSILNNPIDVNVTFFEREDGTYNLHYQSVPFKNYFHTVDFKMGQMKFLNATNIPVADEKFSSLPLLANSVQQFSLWVQSACKVLRSELASDISFTFDCSHALSFCQELVDDNSLKFDSIYSSNLLNHLSLPNLVLSAQPLLKAGGLLITFLSEHSDSLDKYISTSFGFDCKFLPIILGIRCVGHDGDYSSPVSFQPCPLSTRKAGNKGFAYHRNLLAWESKAVPLVFPQGEQLPSVICEALCSSVRVFLSFQNDFTSSMCVQTAVKVLQVFMSNTVADFSPQFWKPLSDALHVTMEPHLHCLQTQLLLHHIHMHLTTTETDCPICLNQPISDHIGLFSFKALVKSGTSPKILALVHKEKVDDAVSIFERARSGRDVHVFDCVSQTCPANNNSFFFHAPLCLLQQDYKVTPSVFVITDGENDISNVLSTALLNSYQIPFGLFKFFQGAPSDKERDGTPKSFCEITSHVSDGNSSNFEISLHSRTASSFNCEMLKTNRVSSTTINLSIEEFTYQLNCPYPVVYEQTEVKHQQEEKSILVHCPRAVHNVTEERPLFIVSPDKQLFSLLMSQDALTSLISQQLTSSKSELQRCESDRQVNLCILELFKTSKYFFKLVQLNGSDLEVVGLLLVNNRLFDYENHTPVVDVAFCLFDECSVQFILPVLDSIPPQLICIYEMNKVEHQLFCQLLQYFALQTRDSCNVIKNSASHFGWLIEKNVQQYFSRAIISLNFSNIDHFDLTADQKVNVARDLSHDSESDSMLVCHNCGKVSESLINCPHCKTAKYCNEECQRAHWKVHKSACSNPESQPQNDFRPFPLSRYWYDGDFRYYYAYGNTSAEDFLENCLGVEEPQALLLGCGDIRSCFFTVWKHFDFSISKAPRQFSGVHFVLNDCSSSVQARNILFLYLCCQLPTGAEERKHWLCAVWAIWYCHELHWQHKDILDASLKTLLAYSDSLDQWASTKNPLGLLVKFTSPTVLAEVSEVWKMWLHRKINVTSVDQMNFLRCNELTRHNIFKNLESFAFAYTHNISWISGEKEIPYFSSRQSEVSSFVKTGNCFAENVLSLDLSTFPTTVNPTMFERSDGVYNLHYGSMPFSGYCHTIEFSPGAMKSAGIPKNLSSSMLVQSQFFKSFPLLSNSFQQFTMWIQSANRVTNNESTRSAFSFTFNNLDAVVFCQELHFLSDCRNQFDVINASNLFDHLSPPNLILPAIVLLKENGILICSSLLYKNFNSNFDEYIASCFGFDCKLLPVILGIRCINHEGAGYASTVMVEPAPPRVGDVLKIKQCERSSAWQKVSAQPLVLPQLPQLKTGNITDGIFDAFKVSTYSLFNESGEGQCILNNQCIETAIFMLQTFASTIIADVNNYRFWEPLSSTICHNMKPYLSCLQTQLLLHKMHLHLTVGKDTCPTCNCGAVEEYLGLFCAEVPLPIRHMTPHFVAIIHQYSSSDVHYLCKEAMSGKDVHIFDIFDGGVEHQTLKLKFFAPLQFAKNGYKVAVALSYMMPEKNMIISCLPTRNLQDLQADFVKYNFSSHTSHSVLKDSSFGKLALHTGDGESMQSEICLSNSVFKASSQHKLSTTKISSSAIKLTCGQFHYSLELKYPINYNGIKVKFSKLQGHIEIDSPRHFHDFSEERPMFIALPDHQLSLPPQHVKDEVLVCHSGMQYTQEEKNIYAAPWSVVEQLTKVTPLMTARRNLMYFFQNKETYFCIRSPQNTIRGLVVVNHRLFDYCHRAPAIDLAFYIANYATEDFVIRVFSFARNFRNFIAKDEGFEVLCKALNYFAARTIGTCRTACKPNKFSELVRRNVDQYFTRAVVYLLYRDPENCGLQIAGHLSDDFAFKTSLATPAPSKASTDQQCDYCSKYLVSIKKCAKCKKVQYCSRDCQVKHWLTHKHDCKKVFESKDTEIDNPAQVDANLSSICKASNPSTSVKHLSNVCSFCGRSSKALKRCRQCGSAQYCGKECQGNHWAQHKSECKRLSASFPAKDRQGSTNPSPQLLWKTASCAFCGAYSAQLKSCTRCGKVKYCGKECQRKHWNEHKHQCK